MLLLLPALLCALGCLWIPRLRQRRSWNIYVFSLTLVTSVLLFLVTRKGNAEWTLLQVTPLFSIAFRVDAVNRVFLLLLAFLWPLAALYAFEYMAHEEREARFFTFYTLSYAVTQLLALSANLFTLYLFYECLTLITLPLVTHKEDGDSLRAGVTYLKYTIGGAALGLVGLMVLGHFGASGSFAPGGLLDLEGLSSADLALLRVAFLCAFLGFGAKAALFPLSPWLPRASVAPTPVTALLHAVAVVNAGVFACLRLTYDCFGPAVLAGSWAQTAVLLLSAFTILFGAVMAVRERHLKRRLAWSTVYHLSYMLFSLSLLTPAGLNGALTHLVFHGFMKISLFFCAGAFLVRAEAEYLPQLRGMGRALPWTVSFYTLAGLALTGIPPLIGFQSKWAILTAAVPLGTWPAWIGAAAVILSSVLAAVYLLEPAVQMIFLPGGSRPEVSDPSWRMLLPLGLLAACIVLLGIWPGPVRSLIDAAVALY
ncbi:MAG: proton-conducting membrane transporter [Clostridia bacterium]|nr:proton-conducting membrane transporter [Clostridia bacterium]